MDQSGKTVGTAHWFNGDSMRALIRGTQMAEPGVNLAGQGLMVFGSLSWAISCTEWYNLFAAQPDLLEAILGKPVQQARDEYVRFASGLADAETDEQLLKVAAQYAAL